MIEVLTVVHITVAAAWFGHKLLIPRDLRVSAHDPEHAGAQLIGRMRRAELLGITSGLLTLGTGIWLVVVTTGFDGARVEIYIAIAAVVAMFLVGFLFARPAWRRIRQAIEADDAPAAAGGVVAFNRALSLESLLWILALTMMIL